MVLDKIKVKDLAALIGSNLKKHGINAVLTGGACVTIYSKNIYQSFDLDFVAQEIKENEKPIKKAMRELGFRLTERGHFENPKCPYIVEFLPPPLAIGSEPVKDIVIFRTNRGNFNILSPTDCVKDRLAAYYHWNDPQSLEQALMVAKKHKIDLKEVKRWSQKERHLKKYNDFIGRLNT